MPIVTRTGSSRSWQPVQSYSGTDGKHIGCEGVSQQLTAQVNSAPDERRGTGVDEHRAETERKRPNRPETERQIHWPSTSLYERTEDR